MNFIVSLLIYLLIKPNHRILYHVWTVFQGRFCKVPAHRLTLTSKSMGKLMCALEAMENARCAIWVPFQLGTPPCSGNLVVGKIHLLPAYLCFQIATQNLAPKILFVTLPPLSETWFMSWRVVVWGRHWTQTQEIQVAFVTPAGLLCDLEQIPSFLCASIPWVLKGIILTNKGAGRNKFINVCDALSYLVT